MSTVQNYPIHQTIHKIFSIAEYKILLQYTVTFLAALFTFLFISEAYNFDLNVPFKYSSDAVFGASWIKTIMDTGWYLHNPYLSAPGQYNFSDFPLSEGFHFIIIKLIALIIRGEVGFVLNIFYMLSYPLTACTSLFVFKRLGLIFPFAFAASMLFSLQTYHFARSEVHLFLSCYYMVPIGIWLAVLVSEARNPNLIQKPISVIGLALACFIIGSSGVYYAFFTCFFILVTGILYALNEKALIYFKNALLYIGIISSAVVSNIAPYLLSIAKNGKSGLLERSYDEVERHGLKIIQMLLPPDFHRVESLRDFSKNYYHWLADRSIDDWNYIGMIAGIGFLLLLALLFAKNLRNSKLLLISHLNLSAILLASIGAFGGFFAFTISQMIRCYSRISIFIAFLALFAFFYLVQSLKQRYSILNRMKYIWIAAFCLIVTGIYDQTTPILKVEKELQPAFYSDKKFVQDIENELPMGSMVFQLPYISFPEAKRPDLQDPYEHFKPYLHSHTLHWSFGAFRGSLEDKLHQSIAFKPPEEMVNTLVRLGFNGITISRAGITGKTVSLEQSLTKILKKNPLRSKDGMLLFYSLIEYKKKFFATHPTFNSINYKTLTDIALEVKWDNGFSYLEGDDKKNWRWCNKKGCLTIINKGQLPIKAKLSFRAESFYGNRSILWMNSDIMEEKLIINQHGSDFSKIIEIPPGRSNIYFKTDAKKVLNPVCNRELYFRLFNYKLTPI